MRFTLTYDGPLASNANPQRKHEIRLKLHPQIKALWNYPPMQANQDWVAKDSKDPIMLKEVAGHGFAALVISGQQLYAELDIVLLRPGTPGGIVVTGGDIDNRLKTLFDALRRPIDPQEIPKNWSPAEDEDPLFCLLEDDHLISRVSVRTERLLEPNIPPSHVRLFINVEVRAWTATWGNLGIIA
ncbi:hypothetical protein [Catenulispora rubra]|uniref:hypothetical protein n=1 Tax=Catenulispora rubra TaxID=280293 RepID=UPI0018925457|nr:hypothetical protein [Catenulispora rubra]